MESFISVQKQARFCIEGNPASKKLLIVLHGYGQLPTYFIRKFSVLFSDWQVLAPEGLHRFYLKGSSGRVGASWMTKEAREQDIEDNYNYLSSLVSQLLIEKEYEEVVLLGFSQGAATAARFFYKTGLPIDRFIVWASVLPPDLDPKKVFEINNSKQNNTFVIGDEDQYFTNEQRQEILEFFKDLGYQTKIFQGLHDIDEKTLEDML